MYKEVIVGMIGESNNFLLDKMVLKEDAIFS